MMEAAHHQPHSPSQRRAVSSNGSHPSSSSKDVSTINDNSSLTAAADLIRTLDSAFAEMSSLSASAARDADNARRNAREASEVARRYTARSYAGHPDTSIYYDMKANGKEATSSQDDKDSGDHVNGESIDSMDGTRKRKISNKVQSSSERLALSHAEDVLSLSLELERTKQALENERMAHDDTRSGLTEARAKNAQLDTQMQKLLDDMETQRGDHDRQVDRLQQELNRAQMRVEAAEEDAQLALDLAKGNADSREQLETWLQRALQEIELLRGQFNQVGVCQGALPPDHLVERPKRKAMVRFAESPTIVEETPQQVDEVTMSPKSQASRSMVAAGRHLLHRAKGTPNGQSVHVMSLTPNSAERRKKLRQRLTSLDDHVDLATLGSARRSPSVHGIDMDMATKAIETCRTVTRLLRESGQRIGLTGQQWWGSTRTRSDDDHVESMAKQFCTTVEVRKMCVRDFCAANFSFSHSVVHFCRRNLKNE
jgi:hypothetical protein